MKPKPTPKVGKIYSLLDGWTVKILMVYDTQIQYETLPCTVSKSNIEHKGGLVSWAFMSEFKHAVLEEIVS